MPQEDKTLGELFSDLSRDTATLVRQEVRLASAELSAKASRVGRHAAFIAVGGAVAYAGLLGIMAGLVVVLETAGLTWWASAFIVGVASRSSGTCSCSGGSRRWGASRWRHGKPSTR
jgi:hypothetical protein